MTVKPREMFWELRETPEQRAARARSLRALYARVDPEGWDARRLPEEHRRVLARSYR